MSKAREKALPVDEAAVLAEKPRKNAHSFRKGQEKCVLSDRWLVHSITPPQQPMRRKDPYAGVLILTK